MNATKARRTWRDSLRLFSLLALLVAAVATLPASQAGAAKKAPPGDPPGNNGTVKIKQDDPAQDDTLDTPNEPHGTDCRILLAFFGFDAGQKAIITFTGQPPSAPKDTPVLEDKGADGKGVDISSDAAAGGKNDPEPAYVPENLAQAVKDAGLTEHPKQGYHLKLTLTVKDKDGNDVPGATKHKVFWLAPCAATTPPPSSAAASTLRIAKAQEGSGQGPYSFDLNCDHSPLNRTFTLNAGEKLDIANVPPGTTCAVTETDNKGAVSTTITEDPPFGAASDGTVKTTAEKSTIVTFKNKFPGTQVTAAPPDNDIRPPSATQAGSGGAPGTSVGGTNTAANPGTSVLGTSEVAPQATATLPRTGNNPRPLTATGLSALAAGLALLAGSRRRRS
jgi:LPXTG-motif cell wall-anchored protein